MSIVDNDKNSMRAYALQSEPMDVGSLYFVTPKCFEIEIAYELDDDGKPCNPFDRIVLDSVKPGWMKHRLRIGDIILCDAALDDVSYEFFLMEYLGLSDGPGVHVKLMPYSFLAYRMNATKLTGFTTENRLALHEGYETEVLGNIEELMHNM